MTAAADLAAVYAFADPAPARRIALAMRTGTARQREFETFGASLRQALGTLPVRLAA